MPPHRGSAKALTLQRLPSRQLPMPCSVADGRWGSSVALYVSRGFLRPYVEANQSALPEAIVGFLKGTPKELILETVPMTDSIMRSVVDIIASKYIGRLRHTYVRAKA